MAQNRVIKFSLNGEPVAADVQSHHNVIEVLQTQFGLTGARESCGQGLCGCCTVILDDQAVSGCLYLAPFLDGADVVTVEGLERDGTSVSSKMHSLKQARFNAGTVRLALFSWPPNCWKNVRNQTMKPLNIIFRAICAVAALTPRY